MVGLEQERRHADLAAESLALIHLPDGVRLARAIAVQDDAVGVVLPSHPLHGGELVPGAPVEDGVQVDPRRRVERVLGIDEVGELAPGIRVGRGYEGDAVLGELLGEPADPDQMGRLSHTRRRFSCRTAPMPFSTRSSSSASMAR